MRGWQRFKKNRFAVVSLIFLSLVSLMALFAPVVTHFSYKEQNISERLESPSPRHWAGTDTLGRDLYSRMIYGARISMTVGILTALVALALGTLAGSLAGYFGGWFDSILMRLADLFYIFPSLLLAILLMLVFGRGIGGILAALSLTAWMTQARLVRGQMLQAREFDYVEAARSLGARPLAIIFRHILPNLWGPIIVSLTFQIPTNIMAESFLSFIGLGLEPPHSSWGTLAAEGFRAMKSFPHLIVFPGVILFLTLLAFNYLGDGLRDALDPKSGWQQDLS